MDQEKRNTNVEHVGIDNLRTKFHSLRIGEKIPQLEIKQIKKVTNPSGQSNLSGVDYKYIIEDVDGRILTVNSWTLWKKISAVLQEAGSTQVTLILEHTGIEDYTVKVINS
ncbi:MAG: hypothetical protein ABII79_00945 [bacterium]